MDILLLVFLVSLLLKNIMGEGRGGGTYSRAGVFDIFAKRVGTYSGEGAY